MKKLIGLLVMGVILFFATKASAATLSEAYALLNAGNQAVAAEAAYRSVLASATNADSMFQAEMGLGTALYQQNKKTEAGVEFGNAAKVGGITPVQLAESKVNEGYTLTGKWAELIAKENEVLAIKDDSPEVGVWKGIAQERIGTAYSNLKDWQNAVIAFEKVPLIVGVAPNEIGNAMEGAGSTYVFLKDNAKAQKSYENAMVDGVPINIIKDCYTLRKWTMFTKEENIAYLDKVSNVLLGEQYSIPANAEFIGKISRASQTAKAGEVTTK